VRPPLPPIVEELRERIRRIEGPSARGRAVLPFGIKEIDRHLPGGGLALGALHEVAGGGNGAIDGAAAALFAAGIAAGPSLRIKMAFALGIIDNRTRDDFEKIRKLRNAFAHVPSTIRLDTPSLADSINSLSPPPHGPTQRAWGNMGPRLRFASSMFVYFWSLSNYSLDLEASQQNSSP